MSTVPTFNIPLLAVLLAGFSLLPAQTQRLPDSIIYYRYPLKGGVSPDITDKKIFTYDSLLRLASEESYNSQGTDGKWRSPNWRRAYLYNAASQPIRTITEIYPIPTPVRYEKDTLEYDAQGRCTRKSSWKATALPFWECVSDEQTTYFGSLPDSVVKVSATCIAGVSMPSEKERKVYAPTHEEQITYLWNPQVADWMPQARRDHFFSATADTTIGYSYDPIGQSWVAGNREIRRDMSGYVVKKTQYWNSSTWVTTSLDSTTYSATGRPLRYHLFYGDPSPQTCHVTAQYTYTPFDSIRYGIQLNCAGDTTSKHACTYFPAGTFGANLLQTRTQWIYENNLPNAKGFETTFWRSPEVDSFRTTVYSTLGERMFTYYSAHPLAADPSHQAASPIVLYGNGTSLPICHNRAATSCTLRLFNLQGQHLWSETAFPETSQPLPVLPSGIYLLEAQTAGAVWQVKVLYP